jgi:hypothetical protein
MAATWASGEIAASGYLACHVLVSVQKTIEFRHGASMR